MHTSGLSGWIDALEPREMFTATAPGPTAAFMQYVKGGGDSRTFAILYDPHGGQIERNTLGDDDVRVTSGEDFSVNAKVVGVARSKPDSPVLVRYRVDGITPSRAYAIRVQGQSVADTSENFVLGGIIGQLKVGLNGGTLPLPPAPPPPPVNPQPQPAPPTIGVEGTVVGNATNPAVVTSTFGQVVLGVNFGAASSSLVSATGQSVPMLGATVSGSTIPQVVMSSPFVVSLSASGAGTLINEAFGGPPVYNSRVLSTQVGTMSLKVSGLDPAKQYRFQFLHGDTRATQQYPMTPQAFSLPTGQTASAPLTFNTSPSNASSITAVVVSGTTDVTYTMPPSTIGQASFAGMVIEAAPLPAPPQPPAPPPAPAPPASATLIRDSIRLVQSGQTFDIAYADGDNVVSTTQVAAADEVIVLGPRGLTSRAALVATATAEDGKGLIATYRIEGVDVTGRHAIRINGQFVASQTLFYLKPIIWETPTDDNVIIDDDDGGGEQPIVAGKGVRRALKHRHHRHRFRH